VEDLARVVNNLATLYLETGRCTEAEKLFRRFPSDGPAGLPHN
jgi:Flp pilus assembly protein TadD